MGLIRLLIIAALIYIVWRVLKNLLTGSRQTTTPPQGQPEQLMRKCAQCGVHVPDREAFSHNGKHFCSQEHQRLYLEHHDQ